MAKKTWCEFCKAFNSFYQDHHRTARCSVCNRLEIGGAPPARPATNRLAERNWPEERTTKGDWKTPL